MPDLTDVNTSEILVTATVGESFGILRIGRLRFPCSLGRSGLVTGKREGDGGTPIGCFPLRTLYYRQDRVAVPDTALPFAPISPGDGWCDAPGDLAYNRPVRLPYAESAEAMWRTDHLYDLVVVLGYNDDPVVSGAGSAIFFHLASEKGGVLQATEGCVALRFEDMRTVLALCGQETTMRIELR